MMDYDALAKELYDAGKAVRPVELLSKRYPAMTWGDARGDCLRHRCAPCRRRRCAYRMEAWLDIGSHAHSTWH